MKTPKKARIAFFLLTILILTAASINYSKSIRENNLKLPSDLEKNGKFIKWINKWKERFPQIAGDTFRRVDKGEIISSTNPRFTFKEYSKAEVDQEVEKVKKDKFSVISPKKDAYLSFRKFATEGNLPEQSFIYFYGVIDKKTVSGPIFECKKTKCYFDRPFFTDDYTFYLPEIQEKIHENQPNLCQTEKICSYELFLHQFDLKKNFRNTFASTQLLTDFEEIIEALNDL